MKVEYPKERKTDVGYESEYASYQFQKTERQLREDKLKSILC